MPDIGMSTCVCVCVQQGHPIAIKDNNKIQRKKPLWIEVMLLSEELSISTVWYSGDILESSFQLTSNKHQTFSGYKKHNKILPLKLYQMSKY